MAATFLHRAKSGSSVKWIDMPAVVAKGGRQSLTWDDEYVIQESFAEIIATEAAYYNKIEKAVTNFMNSYLFTAHNDKLGYVNPVERHRIFLNIVDILATSKKFLDELQKRWDEQEPVLTNIFDIIRKYAQNEFKCYVPYMANIPHQTISFDKISKDKNQTAELKKLEAKYLDGKTLRDTMLQPLQRMMRLKLLCESCSKLISKLSDVKQKKYMNALNECVKTINIMHQLITTANNGPAETDHKDLLDALISKMDYPSCAKVDLQLKTRTIICEVEMNGIYNYAKTITLAKPKPFVMVVMIDMVLVVKRVGSRLKLVDHCKRKEMQLSHQIDRVFETAKVPNNVTDALKDNLGVIIKLENAMCGEFRSPLIATLESKFDKEILFQHITSHPHPEKF